MRHQPLNEKKLIDLEDFDFGEDLHSPSACPACGHGASNGRLLSAARAGQGRVACEACGEKVFVVTGNASRIIKVVCPSCGDFAPVNKLDRAGTATVRCKECWEQIAVSTDVRGNVTGIGLPDEAPVTVEEKAPSPKLRWNEWGVMLLILVVIVLLFLTRNF